MCGIAGLWNLDGAPINQARFEQFRDTLAHRGPDGGGSYHAPEASLALGHRRLAILDLSESGVQPMSYGDGRFQITFNGEIYNFLELRAELQALGHSFRTDTDTEVIMAAYAEWGADCQFRFNGMWAFAIWDRQERLLFLSRDRFGVKPLYFLSTPRRFAFSSEMKAFLELEGFESGPDLEVMSAGLGNSFAVESQERCLLRGIRRLLAGHCARITVSGVSVKQWWSTLDHLQDPPAGFAARTERFRELFTDACHIRMRSDVPVVSCLSGGLDSSSIACTIAGGLSKWSAESGSRLLRQQQRVFVATFPGAPNDERAFADQVVAHTGAEPTYCVIEPERIVNIVDRVLWDTEDIFFNFPAAIWLTYQSLRSHGLYVTLDGHGGDELLAGYPQHIFAAMAANGGLWRPAETMRLLGTLRAVYGQDSQWPRSNEVTMLAQATPVLRQAYGQIHRVQRLMKNGHNQNWLRPSASSLANPAAPQGLDGFNRALYDDFHVTVLPTLLRIFDRASMAHGVEIRMPFLDWRLVTFCFALPRTSKIGGGFTKRILRSAMEGVVPEPVRVRKHKVGFASPMREWFEGGLSQWIAEAVERPAFTDCDLWDAKAIRSYIQDRRASATWDYHAAERVWPYLNAARWMEMFT